MSSHSAQSALKNSRATISTNTSFSPRSLELTSNAIDSAAVLDLQLHLVGRSPRQVDRGGVGLVAGQPGRRRAAVFVCSPTPTAVDDANNGYLSVPTTFPVSMSTKTSVSTPSFSAEISTA